MVARNGFKSRTWSIGSIIQEIQLINNGENDYAPTQKNTEDNFWVSQLVTNSMQSTKTDILVWHTF